MSSSDGTVVEDLGLHVLEVPIADGLAGLQLHSGVSVVRYAGETIALKSFAPISSPIRGMPKLYSSSTWQPKLSMDMAARSARAASNECPVNLVDFTLVPH